MESKVNGSGVHIHVPSKRDRPLYTQYRLRRKALSLTNQRLAREAEVAVTTIARELGLEPGRPMSLQLAQRLGDTLGFDPAYVALVHARDVAQAHEQSAKLSKRVRARFRRIRAALDRYLPQQSPFKIQGIGRRLALTLERCRRGISISRLARHAEAYTGVSDLQLGRYEKGLIAVDDEILASWVHSLSRLSPSLEPVSIASLDQIAASLVAAHCVSDTVDWRSHKEIVSFGGLHRLYCPYEVGFDLRVGTSQTMYEGIQINLLHAVQPKKVAPSRVRIVGGRSRGIQIGVMVKGAAELVLSHARFPDEKTDETPEFTVGEAGVFHKSVCKSGALVLVPGNVFRRLEFHSRDCLMAVISIQSNVLMPDEPESQPPASSSNQGGGNQGGAGCRRSR